VGTDDGMVMMVIFHGRHNGMMALMMSECLHYFHGGHTVGTLHQDNEVPCLLPSYPQR
jgi:hypothetical protein